VIGGTVFGWTGFPTFTFGASLGPIFGDFGVGGGGGFITSSSINAAILRFAKEKASITTSRELPGSTHWDPAPVPVGDKGGGAPPWTDDIVVEERGGLPSVVVGWGLPAGRESRHAPAEYIPPPILLPGQVDPGREEHETEEVEVAHTWTHVGSQFLGALFPGSAAEQAFVAGPSTGFNLSGPGGFPTVPAATTTGAAMAYSGGTCPPRKTRRLTIDCATGLEIPSKRRRRPKLLTEGDMCILFQIATLPNNANVRTALARAVRR